jgi:predicted nucleic acid-binding protein
MKFAYFDTSALVKRYVSEQGSAQVRFLLRRHDLLSSAITPIELLSAVWRRKRHGELTEDNFLATLNRIRGDRVRWELVEIGEQVLSRAEEIVQRTLPIRTLDALHVASLITFQAIAAIRVPFITGDRRQRDVAEQMKMEVVWVG